MAEVEKLTGVRLVLTGYGGYDKMKVETVDCSESPQRNEVLVHVRASGVNFVELLCRQGMYNRIPKLPAVLGLEASGDILMIGEDVTKFKVEPVVCVSLITTVLHVTDMLSRF